MLQFFLNPLMLAGLAGISLPVIAHLLSRRKYDVVQWGAMQFLNPSRKTRRKMKLEELLLLLVRILAIALIALAAARPWINSGFLTGYQSAGSRDIVLVIDGSNSMGRSDGLTSLHQKAIRRATEFLATLQPGDTVAVIDARDRPLSIIESPLQDLDQVRESLEQLRPPAGAADLQRACEEAVGILGRCSNGSREIVVLTDRQRCGWAVGSDASWKRFDDVLQFPSVRPDLWVVDVSHGLGAIRRNVSLGQVELSRDLTVPGFPVSLQVPVTNASDVQVDVPIQILINGQRVANLDDAVSVPAQSQATFSRSVRFSTEGTNLVTVRLALPEDSVSADNESHAALQVASAIPVLLVESSGSVARSDWHTFFAQMALTNPENKSPWIVARTVRADEVTKQDLESVAAVVLPDVTRLPAGIPAAILDFAVRGNGVFICAGENTTADSFQRLYTDSGLLPMVALNRIRTADPDAPAPMTIAPYSLEAGWLNRFRERKGASLLQAAFQKWWLLKTTDEPADDAAGAENRVNTEDKPDDAERPVGQPPATIARLNSGDPLLIQAQCGRGSVLLMTTGIDVSMHRLPAVPDYVPFLHEALFQMAASRVQRNVDFGQPLVTVLTDHEITSRDEFDFEFRAPDERAEPGAVRTNDNEVVVSYTDTVFPGVYKLHESSDAESDVVDAFVVNYDHTEDDPAELSDDDRTRLIAGDRMTFVESLDTLKEEMYGDESRSELWALLLWLFLGLLTLEVWMTRRLVMRGHADTESSPQTATA